MVLLLVLVRPAAALPPDAAMDRVFTVRSADSEDRFLGSAFLCGHGSVVVTNAHVVGEAEAVRLVTRHEVEAVAAVIARDPVRDVAVISAPPELNGKPGLPLSPTCPPSGSRSLRCVRRSASSSR